MSKGRPHLPGPGDRKLPPKDPSGEQPRSGKARGRLERAPRDEATGGRERKVTGKSNPARGEGSRRTGTADTSGRRQAGRGGSTRRDGTSEQRRGEARRKDREVGADPHGVHLSDQVVRELRDSARPGKGDILVKVFAEAVAAYAEGDLETAARLGDQSKHMALRSVSVREFLGLVYYAQELWKEAARELAAFRRMTGSTAQNHVIADCYRAMSRPDKALEYCEEIDQRHVTEDVYYEGQIVAAGALGDQERFDDAIGRLLRLDLKPQTVQEHHLRAWYVLADLLERSGRFTQALRWFQAVDDADPELTNAAERIRKLA